MIALIFWGIIIGLLFAPFIAIALIGQSRNVLKEMDQLIVDFNNSPAGDKSDRYMETLEALTALASKISDADRGAVRQATEKLRNFRMIGK